MKKHKKTSFAKLFTALSLLMILSITVSLSIIFFYNLRNIVTKLTELNTRTNVTRSQDMVLSLIKEHEDALKQSAIGITHLFKQREVSEGSIAGYLNDIKKIMPDSLDMYFTNNIMWNKPGGFAAFAGGWVPDDNWNNTKRSWFTDAKKAQGKIAFSEPYVDSETDDVIITLSMTVFNDEGRDIGVVGDDVTVNVMRDMIGSMRDFPGQEMYIINSDGLFITHEDINAVMEKDLFKELKLDKYRSSVLGSDDFIKIDKNIFIYSSSIPHTDWILVSIIPSSVIFKDINSLILRLIVISIAMLAVVVFILVFFVAEKISSPIKAIHSALEKVKDGDLTVKVAVKSEDEIGELSGYFNMTIENIKNLIINVKKESAILSEIGDNLTTNMTEAATAVNEITGNIQNIRGRIINQSASVSETHTIMEQVVLNIGKLNGHIENQGRNVSQVSSAIGEMVTNINSVTGTLVSNTANVNMLKEASEAGRTGLREVASDIQEIIRESEGLMKINAVMENIASQTNLLSMNAAIEAAHAGTAGKGFAVVAGEIRKLAESSSEQSKTIGNVLNKIKGSMDKRTQSTETVLSRFEAIDLSVKTVSDQEENIRNSMEEEDDGSKQVLQSAHSLNEITQQVKSGSLEMLEDSKEVIQESNNLGKATQEITSGMNEMACGAEQMNVAVHHVNEISGKNRDAIAALLNEVSRFKVE
jgi:methyl-accepting chemotaxis protein